MARFSKNAVIWKYVDRVPGNVFLKLSRRLRISSSNWRISRNGMGRLKGRTGLKTDIVSNGVGHSDEVEEVSVIWVQRLRYLFRRLDLKMKHRKTRLTGFHQKCQSWRKFRENAQNGALARDHRHEIDALIQAAAVITLLQHQRTFQMMRWSHWKQFRQDLRSLTRNTSPLKKWTNCAGYKAVCVNNRLQHKSKNCTYDCFWLFLSRRKCKGTGFVCPWQYRT